MASSPFRFKGFCLEQDGAAHPVGTDGVLLGAWAGVGERGPVLDIGAGTGVVALMLAQRTENQADRQIVGVEIHSPSARCAARNFAASPWPERLRVVQQRIQDFTETPVGGYDLIVSNPPFFYETIVSPDPVRRLGRSAGALGPGDLLVAVQRLLAPNGRFCAILPPREGRRLCEMGAGMGLYCTRLTSVRTRPELPPERFLLQLERNPYPFVRSGLLIYENGEAFSPEYCALMQAFYLRF